MLWVDKTAVMNLENAMRGARNPLSSWERSDSYYDDDRQQYILGDNDLALAKRLCNAGSDHRKFVRQIFVSVDITAPIYWWKEYDTYKIGTTANSTSTMHKIHSKPFAMSDFSTEYMTEAAKKQMEQMIACLEEIRLAYLETKEKELWYSMIQLLPSSYQQMRTCTMNYENLVSMYYARKTHKLQEWHTFCDWIEELPYFKELFVSDGQAES